MIPEKYNLNWLMNNGSFILLQSKCNYLPEVANLSHEIASEQALASKIFITKKPEKCVEKLL